MIYWETLLFQNIIIYYFRTLNVDMFGIYT